MSDPQENGSVTLHTISSVGQRDTGPARGCPSLAGSHTGHAARSPAPPNGTAKQDIEPVVAPSQSQIAHLRRLILDVIVNAFGPLASGWLRWPIEWLFGLPAQRFARLGAEFDVYLARGGFAEAARRVLPRFVHDWRAYGTEHVPPRGPLLVVSNHPGAYDVLVAGASLERDDLKVLAGGIPFLRSFSAAERGLIFSGDDVKTRAIALRAAVRHLESGGALLTFPSGHIDADPAIMPGAQDELGRWSPSLELMLRHVPKSAVMVAIVSGVVAPACYRSWLTRVRRKPEDRRRLAEVIQIAGRLLRGHTVALVPQVSFTGPVTARSLATRDEAASATQAIIVLARQAMAQHLSTVVRRP